MTPMQQAESVQQLTGWRTVYQAFDNSFRAFSPNYELDGVSIEAPTPAAVFTRVRRLLTSWAPAPIIEVTTPVQARG